MRRVASSPDVPGRFRSIRTTSGRVSVASRSAASPSAGVGHDLGVLDRVQQAGDPGAEQRMVVDDQHA